MKASPKKNQTVPTKNGKTPNPCHHMFHALSSLYCGGLGSIGTLFLAKSDMENALPLAGGTGISSILLLLWAVKILRDERDATAKKLEAERSRAHSAEMKCLDCDYYRYGKLLSLVIQPDTSRTS